MKQISFEEYKARRDELHKARMLETTARDQELSQHAYEQFIPHIMISFGMRQYQDLLELKVGWNFLQSFVLGYPIALIRYGYAVTRQRIVRTGFFVGILHSLVGAANIWASCPYAQAPNRGTLQFNGWEQGFKNYIDETYHLYDNADRMFYDKMTSLQQRKELIAQLKPINDAEVARTKKAYS